MIKTVVVLFTYNRPHKTLKVLEALKRQSEPVDRLYVFCDGPKNADEYDLVTENVDLVRSYPHPDLRIQTSDTNQGLSRSLVSGISHVFEKESTAIILEDDILPFPDFIHYMKENLIHYQDTEQVFSISAYHFIRKYLDTILPHDGFLSNRFLPWGWGTWRDRWERVKEQLEKKENPYGDFSRVPKDLGKDLPYHVYAVEKSRVDSWAIPLALITNHYGYKHIMPRQPLVNNIGMDQSGTNTRSGHHKIIPVNCPNYNNKVIFCAKDYHNPEVEQSFQESLDALMPPDFFKQLVDKELEAVTSKK